MVRLREVLNIHFKSEDIEILRKLKMKHTEAIILKLICC